MFLKFLKNKLRDLSYLTFLASYLLLKKVFYYFLHNAENLKNGIKPNNGFKSVSFLRSSGEWKTSSFLSTNIPIIKPENKLIKSP